MCWWIVSYWCSSLGRIWHRWFLPKDTLEVLSICLLMCFYTLLFSSLVCSSMLMSKFTIYGAFYICWILLFSLLPLNSVFVQLCVRFSLSDCWWVWGFWCQACVSCLLSCHAYTSLCCNHLSKHLSSCKACISLHYFIILFINTSFYME